jgi:hypothetical protein
VSQRIGALALQNFSMHRNDAQASHAAAELGVAAVRDLLAVLVHPPALPAGSHASAWLPRVQLTVALVLAHIDDGWETSERRKALLSMLFGPSDWITSAAIRALTWIAQSEHAHAMDIHEQFERLEANIPNFGGCCWADTLYEQWQYLPFTTDGEKQSFARKLQELRN